jgi:hypothetical protein
MHTWGTSGHTGFGIQREGDLMSGTVAAAEYC